MKPVVTVMLIVLTAFCQAECPIECFCDRVTTCTGDKLLTRFPKIYTGPSTSDYGPPVLSTMPIRVELHDYAVKHLSRQDFLYIISNLTEISISRNSLETFDNDTFSLDFTTSSSTSAVMPSTHSRTGSGNTAVNGGDVAGDSLRDTSSDGRGSRSTFSKHDETQRTYFSDSQSVEAREQTLSSDSFSAADVASFLQLKILDLSQNKLKYFVGGWKLQKLKILDLSSNMLQQVYELSAIQSLESVNLRDNRISYLEANIFQNLRNLQYVNLDGNVLGFVHPSTFSNLPALAHLILSSNPISNLLPGFYWNSRVQFVDVSNVGLTSIPPSLTKTVRDFRCANNNLTIIRQTDFESYPNAGLLVLDENAIDVVEDDAFGRLDFLSRLWMNGNRLRRIPQNLPPSLRSLQLEGNLIANLNTTDFKNLRRLEELNLHSNRITSIPPSVFSELKSLKSLDLRSNLIDVIYRDSFANLSKLETLDISQNPIKVIVTGAFESLRKVALLHLSRLMEHIELDVSSFKPLQNLQILELDDSPHLALTLFSEGGFSYFPYLVELNLQRCELDDPNLVSNALVELNLHTVKMNGNPWDCGDLHGSAVFELISRRIVVDGPTCARPSQFRDTPLATLNFSTPRASLNVINSPEKNPNFTQPFVTPLTRSSDNKTENFTSSLSSASGRSMSGTREHDATPSSAFSLEDAQNTNFPEKVTHVSQERKTGQEITELLDTAPVSHHSVTNSSVLMTKPTFSSQTTYVADPLSSSHVNTTYNVSSPSSPSVQVIASSPNHDSASGAAMGDNTKKQQHNTSSSSLDISKTVTEANTFVDMLEGDGDAIPTQSYFDYPSSKSKNDEENNSDDGDKRDSSSVSGGRANASESRSQGRIGVGNGGTNSELSSRRSGSDKGVQVKTPSNLIPISRYDASTITRGQRTRRPPSSSSSAGVGSSEETKTNDDNVIIDESKLQRTGRRNGEEEQQEVVASVQRSIDGFPPAYPDSDRVANQAPSESNNKDASNPKYSYLKLNDNTRVPRRRGDLPNDNNNSSADSHNMAVIVKTLVISALTCLGSILSLFFISFTIYRYSLNKNRGVFSCARRCSREEGEDIQQQQGTGMVYTRFGRKESKSDSSGRGARSGGGSSSRNIAGRYHPNRESDSDQVELSGISNSLYFENEDIYHIT